MINTEKLKTIDYEIVLSWLKMPYKRAGNRIMATALYRDEKTASISVQERNGKYLWLDFGDYTKKGSWIDLVMAVKGLNYLDALQFLNNIENAEIRKDSPEKRNFSFDRQKEKSKSEIKITSISDTILDINLINYLHLRAIFSIPDWLKQINYKVIKDDKAYHNTAVGIINSAGGYAVRNQKVKMNIGKSSYSLFRSSDNADVIFVVEGLFDGLTITEKRKDINYDLIILNSTKNLNNKVIEILNSHKKIVIGLDSDNTGREAQNKIINKLNNSKIYKLNFQSNDLNEAWILKQNINVIKIK
ncbi:MAG: toprim domain-containing protein [bacterium]